jgi:TrpR-related protein YerC/YecD
MKNHKSKQSPKVEVNLYEALVLIQTADEAKQFLQDLCTPAEIQAMADRWRVVDLIKQGKSYRQIYESTGISMTTVGRVARYMMLGAGGYDLIYQRVLKKNYENTD